MFLLGQTFSLTELRQNSYLREFVLLLSIRLPFFLTSINVFSSKKTREFCSLKRIDMFLATHGKIHLGNIQDLSI